VGWYKPFSGTDKLIHDRDLTGECGWLDGVPVLGTLISPGLAMGLAISAAQAYWEVNGGQVSWYEVGSGEKAKAAKTNMAKLLMDGGQPLLLLLNDIEWGVTVVCVAILEVKGGVDGWTPDGFKIEVGKGDNVSVLPWFSRWLVSRLPRFFSLLGSMVTLTIIIWNDMTVAKEGPPLRGIGSGLLEEGCIPFAWPNSEKVIWTHWDCLLALAGERVSRLSVAEDIFFVIL
jgi:hypothetical protein